MAENFKTYEGMFLLDVTGGDPNAGSEPVKSLLARHNAQVLALKPWDDRKLSYEIRGKKRGLYVLAYFSLDPLLVREIEHDCRLDERFLRILILRREKIAPETLAAETPISAPRKVHEEAHVPQAAPADLPNAIVDEIVPDIGEDDAENFKS
ncbi:MAG: 30S ribosomal protein S6 [Planctomycetes bacterium]|nr:30S ribosomal protein S6 [Planctomycetota bacterium]